MDAAQMARDLAPPTVTLPRGTWVPFFGRLLGRILPPKKHTGRVLSYSEFIPFHAVQQRAQDVVCEGCGEDLRKAPVDADVPLPTWLGCECPDGPPQPVGALSEEEFRESCKGFLTAMGIPWRPVYSLPGAVVFEVMQDFFECQTWANTPGGNQTNGKSSPSRDNGRQKETRKTNTQETLTR